MPQIIAGTLIWFFLIICSTAAGKTLTLNVGNDEWQPWMIVEGSTIKGVTADLLKEVANRTDYQFHLMLLPHNRMLMEFRQGKIDMEATICKAWRQSQAPISVYTAPFYATRDVVLVNKGRNIKAGSVKNLSGLSLGCGLGYFYPEGFQEAFEHGELIRKDNRSVKQNLIMLSLKRIDGIIIDELQAAYLFKQTKLNPDDFEIAYAFQPSMISMRLHKKYSCILPQLNKALKAMKNDGTVDRIVARYTH